MTTAPRPEANLEVFIEREPGPAVMLSNPASPLLSMNIALTDRGAKYREEVIARRQGLPSGAGR
jgi:hypothetical protein